ncbi:MAG: hypothetical protein Q7W45_03130 [Bacteroidota bacterium]|nr:hypothetical protein [Bacteroidota bacterium]MDP3145753.1 hypothetical protein [Bacteroidota bacterium]MDP3556838.1 hypothetical protein [Bacteroidota bacterium]
MKHLYLLTALIISSLSIHAQVKKSTVQITKEVSTGIGNHENLTIKFVGPTKQPVKRGVKMIVDRDTIFPEINEKGIYTDHLPEGSYKLKFEVPYWYEATIEKLKCGKKENINITVYFNPKDI